MTKKSEISKAYYDALNLPITKNVNPNIAREVYQEIFININRGPGLEVSRGIHSILEGHLLD